MTWDRFKLAGPYVAVPLAAWLAVFAGMRLEQHNPAMPLGYNGGDVMLILPMVQALQESGSHWSHPRLAAPGQQDLRDFPVIDELHFAWLRGLCWLTGDLMMAFNGYFLLTYPLTALTTLYALRRLGVSLPAAACGAILYAFTPYHQLRNVGHYFLSAYYMVPLLLVVAMELAWGQAKWVQRFRGRVVLFPVLTGIFTAISGAYYAYFGCAVLAFAGIYGSVAQRSSRPFLLAGALIGLIVAIGITLHLPAIQHQMEVGRNPAPTFRLPDEAETYGLKITQLVMPIPDHRVPALARLRAQYDSPDRPVQTENKTSSLGLVGTGGLILLLGTLLLPVSGRLRAIGAVCGFLVLFGTVGGGGALFNQLVSPQVRAYCRVSIFIAFLCILAVCVATEHLLTRSPRIRRYALLPLFAFLTAFGIWDQTDREWFTPEIIPGRIKLEVTYQADGVFYSQADSLTARDGSAPMVFCLPYMAYPETTQVGALLGYDHARGVVHSRTARWSFGAMKGRIEDEWQRETAILPVPELLQRITAAGFTGLYVNTRGLSRSAGDALLRSIRTATSPEAELVMHSDSKRFLFDLRAYADQHAEALSAVGAADRRTVRVEWQDGFLGFEPPADVQDLHLMQPRATLVLVNPADDAQAVRLSFTVRTMKGTSTLSAHAEGVWTASAPVSPKPADWSAAMTVPPGRTTVTFECPPPEGWRPTDGRRAVLAVSDFSVGRVD